MSDKPQLEKMFEVWCGEWHYEIGPDRDGVGVIEIRYFEGKSTKSELRICLSKEEAALVAKALSELAA